MGQASAQFWYCNIIPTFLLRSLKLLCLIVAKPSFLQLILCISNLLPHGHVVDNFEISQPYLKQMNPKIVVLAIQNHAKRWVTWIHHSQYLTVKVVLIFRTSFL